MPKNDFISPKPLLVPLSVISVFLVYFLTYSESILIPFVRLCQDFDWRPFLDYIFDTYCYDCSRYTSGAVPSSKKGTKKVLRNKSKRGWTVAESIGYNFSTTTLGNITPGNLMSLLCLDTFTVNFNSPWTVSIIHCWYYTIGPKIQSKTSRRRLYSRLFPICILTGRLTHSEYSFVRDANRIHASADTILPIEESFTSEYRQKCILPWWCLYLENFFASLFYCRIQWYVRLTYQILLLFGAGQSFYADLVHSFITSNTTSQFCSKAIVTHRVQP